MRAWEWKRFLHSSMMVTLKFIHTCQSQPSSCQRHQSNGSAILLLQFLEISSLNGWKNRSNIVIKKSPCKRISWSKWILRLPECFKPRQPWVVSDIILFLNLIPSYYTASKGNSANLLQAGSKRRRTKKQIELEKQQKLEEEAQVQAILDSIDHI